MPSCLDTRNARLNGSVHAPPSRRGQAAHLCEVAVGQAQRQPWVHKERDQVRHVHVLRQPLQQLRVQLPQRLLRGRTPCRSARAGAAVPLGRADPLQAQHAVAAAPRPGEDGQVARQRTGSVAACIGAQRVACACSQLSPRMLADASAARRLRRASSCVERAWVSAAAARLALTCGESLPAGAASPEASRWQQQRLPDKHSAQPGGSGRPHRVLPPPVLEELGRGSRGEDAHAHSVCERLYPVHALACARSCTAKRRSTYSPKERRWDKASTNHQLACGPASALSLVAAAIQRAVGACAYRWADISMLVIFDRAASDDSASGGPGVAEKNKTHRAAWGHWPEALGGQAAARSGPGRARAQASNHAEPRQRRAGPDGVDEAARGAAGAQERGRAPGHVHRRAGAGGACRQRPRSRAPA